MIALVWNFHLSQSSIQLGVINIGLWLPLLFTSNSKFHTVRCYKYGPTGVGQITELVVHRGSWLDLPLADVQHFLILLSLASVCCVRTGDVHVQQTKRNEHPYFLCEATFFSSCVCSEIYQLICAVTSCFYFLYFQRRVRIPSSLAKSVNYLCGFLVFVLWLIHCILTLIRFIMLLYYTALESYRRIFRYNTISMSSVA